MSTKAHEIPTDPDSQAYFDWATKLEYPKDENHTDFYAHSIEITDPKAAFSEAEQRINQQCQHPSGKLDLRGLHLSQLPASISQLATLQVLMLDRYLRASIPLQDISWLNSLPNLRYLTVQRCYISGLMDLSGLTALRYLNVAWTEITELKGLGQLSQLQRLDLSFTKITELNGLDQLSQLTELNLTGLNLTALPAALVNQRSLTKLICYKSQIGNIPTEILSKDRFDNCLPRVRQYFADLKQAAPPVVDMKIRELDNDQIGKTPIDQRGSTLCISYKWNNPGQLDGDRVNIVDDFCRLAKERGVTVLRDTDALNVGDKLSDFMRRIGRGKRVIVILSDAYLKSANCMFELHEIWRTSRTDPEIFRSRVKVFLLPGLQIDQIKHRFEYARYWQQQYKDINGLIQAHGLEWLGSGDFVEFKRMQSFHQDVSDMLKEIADTLAPRDLNQLLVYGLDGLEGLDEE